MMEEFRAALARVRVRETDRAIVMCMSRAAATEALVQNGGTISHHHGVGTDHAPWLRREKGELGPAQAQ